MYKNSYLYERKETKNNYQILRNLYLERRTFPLKGSLHISFQYFFFIDVKVFS